MLESPSVAAEATPLPVGSPVLSSVLALDVISGVPVLGISFTTVSFTVISKVSVLPSASVPVNVALPAPTALILWFSVSTVITLSSLDVNVIWSKF